MLEILSYLVAAACIVTYLRIVLTGDARAFNWCNAIGWPVFVVSIQHGAYAAAALNLFFILVGTIGVLKDRRTARAHVEWADAIAALTALPPMITNDDAKTWFTKLQQDMAADGVIQSPGSFRIGAEFDGTWN